LDLKAAVEHGYARHGARFAKLDDYLECRFGSIDTRFDEIGRRFEEMEAKIDSRFGEMEMKFDARFDRLEGRVGALEVRPAR
jgi:hypothetical protein